MNSRFQSEAAECGLASLAMVAEAHGMRIGLAEMRRQFPLSLKGAKLNQLIGFYPVSTDGWVKSLKA